MSAAESAAAGATSDASHALFMVSLLGCGKFGSRHCSDGTSTPRLGLRWTRRHDVSARNRDRSAAAEDLRRGAGGRLELAAGAVAVRAGGGLVGLGRLGRLHQAPCDGEDGQAPHRPDRAAARRARPGYRARRLAVDTLTANLACPPRV